MQHWTPLEVELTVNTYFEMLKKELAAVAYSKTQNRKSLLSLLNNRSEGSIEFKNQNISAVLIKLGQPYIKGYLPRFNYQKILEDSVINYLRANKGIEKQFRTFADKNLVPKTSTQDFLKVLVEPPILENINEPILSYSKSPVKINYLEREQRNSQLGKSGEEFILKYEKWKLINQGKENLAETIEWVSQEEGDGAGFDILSKNKNGTDKYIEVKTTKLGKKTPFYFSDNELKFSVSQNEKFHLYRLFNFEEKPLLFIKNGCLSKICQFEPISYKGFF